MCDDDQLNYPGDFPPLNDVLIQLCIVQKNTSSSMANRFDSSRPAGLTFFQFFELIYDIYNRIWDDFGDGVSQFFSSE